MELQVDQGNEKNLLLEICPAYHDESLLEKIGFALRCYHALSDFSAVPFERDEYEVYFGLACLTAGAFGEDRQSDIKDAASLINGCITICCGKEENANHNREQ